MVLLIDNYDSFSYNLYQLVGCIEPDIKVVRNDELTIADIRNIKPSHIILSPGPGRPIDAGICEEVVRSLGGEIPILGVCLGHQAICEVYGATVSYAKRLMHGKSSICSLKDADIFHGVGSVDNETNVKKTRVARYHSLSAVEDTIPDSLEVIAVSDDDGEVMAVRALTAEGKAPVYGLQFHPESILTPEGRKILENYINI